MMKQMQKMQRKMEAVQESLAEQNLEVTSGGGAVTVKVNLQSHVESIKLDPEFLKEEDVAMVEETILEAVQEGLKQAGEKSEAAMQEVTDEFQVPGLPKFG